MSSVLQTPKIKTVRTLSNRNLNLLVVAALIVITLLVAFTSAVDFPAARAVDYNAYLIHRQGEWLSVPIRLSNAEAYQIFRRGEVASVPVLTNSEAYHLFRLGEWASVNIPEIAVVDMTTYHRSERTSIPVLFTKYQRSEWFGK